MNAKIRGMPHAKASKSSDSLSVTLQFSVDPCLLNSCCTGETQTVREVNGKTHKL